MAICIHKRFTTIYHSPQTIYYTVFIQKYTPIYETQCSVFTGSVSGDYYILPPCDTEALEAGSALCNNDGTGNTLVCYRVITGYSSEVVEETRSYIIPGYYTTNNNQGWNAGAEGVSPIYGGGTYHFSANTDVIGVVTGITSPASNIGYGYSTIEYGIYITGNKANVIEEGVHKSSIVQFVTDDIFKIIRYPTYISYQLNDVEFHRTTALNQPIDMIVDLSLYSGGDKICDANVTDGLLINIEPMAGSGKLFPQLMVDVVYVNAITMAGSSSLSARASQGMNVTLEPFNSRGSDYNHVSSYASLLSLNTVAGQDILTVDSAIISTSMYGFSAVATMISGAVGTSDADLLPLNSIGSDYIYNEVSASLKSFITLAGQYPVYDAVGLLNTPPISLEGIGTSYPANSALLSIPKFSITAYTGAVMRTELSLLSLDATGTVDNIGRAEINVPSLSLTIYATSGKVGKGYLFYRNAIALVGYGGATSNLKSPTFTLSGSGLTGSIAQSNIVVPDFSITGNIILEEFGSAEILVPSFSAISGIGNISYGHYIITASSFGITTLVNDAFIMNISNKAVTQYTDYPFNSIITAEGLNYGVTDTGLYLLDGDTDDITGVNPLGISASFEMHPTNYDSIQTKNIAYCYIQSRSEGQFTVNAVADEVVKPLSESVSHGRDSLYNWRVQLGRGVKAINWGFTVSNIAGADFQIQGFKSEPLAHKRKI